MIVKLPTISLQTSKFTENELTYHAFSKNHFMEESFMFQWGASFLSGGCPMEGSSVGGRGWSFEKNCKMECTPPMPHPRFWEIL